MVGWKVNPLTVSDQFSPPKLHASNSTVKFHKQKGRTMTTGTLVAGPLSKIGRDELAQLPVPQGTETHKPVSHHDLVTALVETLGFRHIGVVQEEYAVSPDAMKLFGVLDLETQMEGCRFSIGIRNSNDK
jgi:hypothetical protein